VGEQDYVQQLIAQWQRQRPEVDVAPMGVIGRISRLSRLLERQIEELFIAHGLQGGRFDVLAALVRAGEPHRLTPTQLYNSLLVSSGAITNRIDRLVDEGLVTRGSHARDRRSLPVQLTAAGRDRLDQALIAHVKNEEELLSSLDSEERDLLSQILRRWLIALGDLDQPAEALGDVSDSSLESSA
jgi:DNA-binding MarR family transcriptional regulator